MNTSSALRRPRQPSRDWRVVQQLWRLVPDILRGVGGISRVVRHLCLSFLMLLGGCASVGAVQTADTLGKGNLQFAVEPGVQAASSTSGTPGAIVYPHFDAALRYGLSEGVDVGARLGYSMLELQAKFLLTRPGSGGVVASLAPTVGGLGVPAGGSNVGLLTMALPVLFGFQHAHGNELVVGARLQSLLVLAGVSDAGSGAVFSLGAGGSVGYSLRLHERFALIPEVAVVLPLTVSGTSGGAAGQGSAVVQFKVGVVFGKQRSGSSPVEAP
jgi:hypothetical protein